MPARRQAPTLTPTTRPDQAMAILAHFEQMQQTLARLPQLSNAELVTLLTPLLQHTLPADSFLGQILAEALARLDTTRYVPPAL